MPLGRLTVRLSPSDEGETEWMVEDCCHRNSLVSSTYKVFSPKTEASILVKAKLARCRKRGVRSKLNATQGGSR